MANQLKIWLDDVRPAPDGWSWAKTVQEAQLILQSSGHPSFGKEIVISFDHDLGEEATGYDLATHLEAAAAGGHVFNIVEWRVHSANPVGAARIKAAMTSFDKIRNSKEE